MPTPKGGGRSVRETYDAYLSEFMQNGAMSLSGNTLNLSAFESTLPRAVAAGYVTHSDASFVLDGIRNGFDLCVQEQLAPKGFRHYRNYKSAYENAATVSDALRKRVASGKTLRLGAWRGDPAELPEGAICIVPQGAVHGGRVESLRSRK